MALSVMEVLAARKEKPEHKRGNGEEGKKEKGEDKGREKRKT